MCLFTSWARRFNSWASGTFTVFTTPTFFFACLILADFITLSGSSSQLQAKGIVSQPAKINAANQDTSDLTKSIDSFKAALSAYKAANDEGRWQECWKDCKEVISQCITKHIDVGTVIKMIPDLSELGLCFADGGNVKVWSFPKVAECGELLVMWQDVIAGPANIGRSRSGRVLRRASAPVVVTRLQALKCPVGTSVSSARLLMRAQSASVQSAPDKAEGKALVLLGRERKTATVWLSGYKMSAGRWLACPELFSGVPPFLMENLQGQADFSGNNLVVSLESSKPDNQATEKSNGGRYKISFVYTGDHYAFDNKNGLDPATAVAIQFVQAIGAGRMDLVKAWLADSKLASIPSYLGLYARGESAPALRLVPMAAPLAPGIARFRIVTFDRDDLIVDVGKLKAQWVVKAVYIAPSDPFAKKLVSTTAARPADKSGNVRLNTLGQ